MRALIQRVLQASVSVAGEERARIGQGILLFLGIGQDDGEEDVDWLCQKVTQLRIFDDEAGVPNLSVRDIGGDILAVSQFTLHALVKKGNRPSYIRAAKPEVAIPLYETFLIRLAQTLGKPLQSGVFGANMQVKLINDGPITIWIDTKNRE